MSTEIETFPIINHNKLALERVLAGDLSAGQHMFEWSDSPQGGNYWSEKVGWGKSSANPYLPEEALSYMRWLLKSTEPMAPVAKNSKLDYRSYE